MNRNRRGREASANNQRIYRPRRHRENQHVTPSQANNPFAGSALEAFTELLRQLISKRSDKKRQAHFMPLLSKDEAYNKIGSLSTLLGLGDDDTSAVLIAAGLARSDKNRRFCIIRKAWEQLTGQIAGLIFQPQYGAKRYAILSLGGQEHKDSFKEQLSKEQAAPSIRSLVVEELVEKLKSNAEVKKALQQVAVTPHNNIASRDEDATRSAATTDRVENAETRKAPAEDQPPTNEQPLPKKRKKNTRQMRETDVGGTKAIVPNGFKLLHKNALLSLSNMKDKLVAMKEAVSKKKSELTEFSKIAVGTFAARFPQIADVGVEQMLCCGGLLFASQLKLYDGTSENNSLVPVDSFHQILPSRSSIKNYVLKVAAHKIIHLGMRMVKAIRLFLGCDKGSGVLVKMVFFYDRDEKRIKIVNLDFDKANDDAKGGGQAIKSSVRKYTFANEDADDIKFDGGGSDSGGGFTNKAMHTSLTDVSLAKSSSAWMHIACTSHNDQSNLRVAILAAYGGGGLDKRNVMQFLHSFAYVQD